VKVVFVRRGANDDRVAKRVHRGGPDAQDEKRVGAADRTGLHMARALDHKRDDQPRVQTI
jgi:hypothetical protein